MSTRFTQHQRQATAWAVALSLCAVGLTCGSAASAAAPPTAAEIDALLDGFARVDAAALRARQTELQALVKDGPARIKAMRAKAAASDAEAVRLQARLTVLQKLKAVLAAPPPKAPPPAAAAPAKPATGGPDVDKLIDTLIALDPKTLAAKEQEMIQRIAALKAEAKSNRDQAAALETQIAPAQKRLAVLPKLIAALDPPKPKPPATPTPKPTPAPPKKMPAAAKPSATTQPIASMKPAAPGAAPASALAINYQEHIAPIFAGSCIGCHNPDKAKGGLNLTTFEDMLAGGGSGEVIRPGDPDGSRLARLVSHVEEPSMPPLDSKLPDDKLALLRSWIAQGALASANSAPTVLAKREAPAPRTRIKQLVSASRRKGPPPMPAGLSVQPRIDSLRPPAVRGLAVSPRAPLVAVSGHEQILLYHLDTAALLGVIPFDHGTPQAMQFSIDGSLLVCAGGRAGESGIAVAYDVRTGEPLGEFGKAYDALLAVAISPDGALIATGGPSRKVRVYHTDTGLPAYEITAHNDWILALAFNEWGDLLATSDRSGGLFVWESETGREVHALRGHTGAVSAVSFHGESDTLASAGEDGTVRLWEMEEGGQVKSWKAHDKASLDVVFAADGRLATAGADHRLRVWKQDGSRVMNVEKLSDWGYRAAFSGDGSRVLVGTWDGVVGIYETATGKSVGQLTTRPIPPTPRPLVASTTQATASKPAAPGVSVAATASGAASGSTTAGAGAASATAAGGR